MTAAAFLSAVAVGLIQWWLWCIGLTLLLALAVKAAGPRRPAVHDILCRALVVLELVLLPASLALSLRDVPAARAAPVMAAIPAGAAGPVVAPSPSPVLPGPAVLPAPEMPLPSRPVGVAATLPPAGRGPIELGLPAWAAAALVLVWLAGVSIGSARLARRLRRSRELVSSAADVPPGPLLESLRALERRMGVRRPVRLVTTERASVPLLAGLRRPSIILPAQLAERLSPAALEPLLAHELAHHARRDVPWKLAEAIAAVVAWPVPLQRRAGRTMARASEVLCDRMAVDGAPDREDYARVLFEVLAADRGTPSVALGAPAVASKSFLRRRIEIVLAGEPVAASLPAARRLALILAALAAALPVVAVRVSAAGQAAPEAAKPAPVIRGEPAPAIEGDDTPEPIRRLQEELRKLHREQAVVEYAAGRHGRAETHLRRAHDLGATTVDLIPLGDAMGALDLGRAASPFLASIIEKKFGPLLRIDPGHVADAKEGVLIQEMGVLEKIRDDLFSAPREDRMISFEMRSLRLGAEEAARWARILGEYRNTSAEWSHALTPEESARLEVRIEEAGGAKEGELVVEGAPTLSTLDGHSSSFSIYTQRAYIERYRLVAKGETRVADPVIGILNEGIEVECFQRILDDHRVRGFFRVTRTRLKGFQEVRIDLPPWAHRVPIQIPIIEQDVALHEAVIAEGDGAILASIPGEREEKLHGPLERSWIWMKCDVIGE